MTEPSHRSPSPSGSAERLARLRRDARLERPRVALLSTWDYENNAVRLLAAVLREAGHEVIEIYFKDWVSNHLEPATPREIDNLVRLLRRERINLLAISIRASAYVHQASILTRAVQERVGIPVMWGGMHPTMDPKGSIEVADMLLLGEGELALRELVDRLDRGADDLLETPNLHFRVGEDEVVRNPLMPLIKDLDTLPFRDYHSHDRKFIIHGKGIRTGDPQHGDPVFQMMGSRGCIYKCSYCYNSTYKKDVYPGQRWFRTRSPESMIREIRQARTHWPFKRVRFDDEVFNFQLDWLKRFCELYSRDVGLPFEIFTEPKLVSEERLVLLREAGLTGVYMGIQSSERVTGHLYDRRVKNHSISEISQLFHRLGITPHYQLIFDDPVSTEADKRALFEMIASFPHPYDLYLFSMTVFPGSELNKKLIDSGLISEYDIDGEDNTRTFYQHRVNLNYPRPVEDTFWIALTQMLSKPFIPQGLLRTLSRSEFLKRHPWPVIQLAHAANFVKLGSTAGRMVLDGEMTATLVRRWLSADRIITT